ncbi:hypothetical protein N0A02_00685 [Paraburkholderia acidicola]|uniref:Type I restriction endonuclease subunit M n=1 Tax=Paraburkholderia acidicola TaxID=1912599 RepID=A0ABV1LF40_9BURK
MKLTHADNVEPLFSLGHILITPAAIATLHSAGFSPIDLLLRHVQGDWGELDDADRKQNDLALEARGRLLSAYTLPTMIRIWVITEADRSATTILLPREY